MRRRDQAAAFRKATPLGTEIDDRRPFRPRRRKAPPQLRQLNPLLLPSENGRGLGRPNVVAGRQVRRGFREYDGRADLTERRQIVAIGHIVPEIVAHSWTCSSVGKLPMLASDKAHDM